MRARSVGHAWLVGVCILSLALGGCLSRKPTIDEFKELVMGKTEQEVKQAVGSPKRINIKQNEGKTYWYYVYKTVDPNTGKDIPRTEVVFRAGKVIDVKVE